MNQKKFFNVTISTTVRKKRNAPFGRAEMSTEASGSSTAFVWWLLDHNHVGSLGVDAIMLGKQSFIHVYQL